MVSEIIAKIWLNDKDIMNQKIILLCIVNGWLSPVKVAPSSAFETYFHVSMIGLL